MVNLFLTTVLFAQEAEEAVVGTLDYSWLFIKVCMAMVIVAVMAFVFIKFILPRMKGFKSSANSAIQIIDRHIVEPRKNIYLIQFGDRHFLVGSTDNSLSLIGEVSQADVDKAYSS
jgi:flagellar biogenesis protein FliO